MRTIQSQIAWCVRAQWTMTLVMVSLILVFLVFGFRPTSQRRNALRSEISTKVGLLETNQARTQGLTGLAFEGRATRTGGREPDDEHLFLGAMMAANAIQIYADKLLRQAKADPKKATILVVLLGVLLFMWFRMAGGGSAAGPARASATVTDV